MPTLTSEQHERTQRDELQRRYDTLTKRIAALDTDTDRALGSEERQILKERRADMATERDAVSSQLAELESHKAQTESIRAQDIQSNNLVLSITRTSPSSIRTSLRLLDGEIISGLAFFQDEVEGASLREQLYEYPMLAFRYGHEIADFAATVGVRLYQRSIPEPVAMSLGTLNSSVIDLVVDEDLQHLPWETLHDEEGFLGFRHTFGRRLWSNTPDVVNTGLLPLSYPTHKKAVGFSVLIVIPPDLYGGIPVEAQILCDVCHRTNPNIVVNPLIALSRQEVVNALYRKPDIVHWIGHSNDDMLKVGNDFIRVDMFASVASELGQHCLYFFDVCTTGHIGAQKPIGYYLAKQGISSVCSLTWVGVSGYLLDEFYSALLNGKSVGEALQLAKARAQNNVPSWWSYILYGDASWRLVEPKVK